MAILLRYGGLLFGNHNVDLLATPYEIVHNNLQAYRGVPVSHPTGLPYFETRCSKLFDVISHGGLNLPDLDLPNAPGTSDLVIAHERSSQRRNMYLMG